MKQTIPILILAVLLSSCGNGQNNTQEQSKQVQSAIKENMPGSVPAIAGGYTMKAKLNGKTWTATSIMPPEAAGRIIGYYEKQYIGLPYSKNYLVTGKKIMLGEDEVADIFLDDGCSYPLTKVEMEITKVDESWAEGKFFFTTTCSSINKVVKVTDGFFMIPQAKK